MLTFLTLTAASFVTGLALLPRSLQKSLYLLPGGAALLVLFGAALSSIFQLPSSFAIAIVLALCLIRIFYLACKKSINIHKDYIYRILLAPFTFFLFIIIPLISRIKIDIASRNFDAYYAIQDSIFLKHSSSIAHLPSTNELLPAIWSGSTNDRYGVSYLLSINNLLTGANSWWSAKYVFVFCMFLTILSLLGIANYEKMNLKKRIAVIFLLIFSPPFLISTQYFMFGQTFGLAISFAILGIVLVKEFAIDSKLQILVLLLLISQFIIYPAMFFPCAIFIAFVYLNLWRMANWRLTFFLRYLVFSIVAMVIVYAGHLDIFIQRISVWVAGSTSGLSVKSNNLDKIPINIFGQYSSDLSVPLFLGLIPYPYIGHINTLLLITISVLAAFFIGILIIVNKAGFKKMDFLTIIVYVLIFSTISIYAYITNNGYLVLKISTWLMPLILTLIIVNLLNTNFEMYKKSFSSVATSFFAFIILVLVMGTSINQIKAIPNWNSFKQIPTLYEYAKIAKFSIPKSNRVAISMTTGEEAMWVSGLLERSTANNLISLGATNQALGLALSTKCIESTATKKFSEISKILINPYSKDIVPQLLFSKGGKEISNSLRIYHADDLLEGLIIPGIGVYPVSLIEDTRGTYALRWSNGSLCFEAYAKQALNKKIKVEYMFGPDSLRDGVWTLVANNYQIQPEIKSKSLEFTIPLKAGWNTFQIRYSGCSNLSHKKNRSNLADDRFLCIGFKSVKFLH